MLYHVFDLDLYAGGLLGKFSTLDKARDCAKAYLVRWPDERIAIRKVEEVETWSVNEGFEPVIEV